MKLLWLQSGGCGGCTLSWLGSEWGSLFATLADSGIELLWHPSLSESSADEALAILESCAEGSRPFDALCVEGSLLRGPQGTGRFHILAGTGRPMIEWVVRLSGQARHVVAVGSCAAFGGVTAGGLNPTDACGLQYENLEPGGLLGTEFRARGGLPAINVAGCPTHTDWVTETLLTLARDEMKRDDLDELARPRFYTDVLVHHGCKRNEFYEFKASAQQNGEQGCLMENLGCKGTQAHADCNLRPWNGGGSCIDGGYACIRCTEPGFEEPGHLFTRTPKIAGIPIGLPLDMPKAWFVALAALSKSATPERVRRNAVSATALPWPKTVKKT